MTGVVPARITTDRHDSYTGTVRSELKTKVRHRTSAYLSNHLEQDHRGIKGGYQLVRGSGSAASAARFCRGYDELRSFFCGPERDATSMSRPIAGG